MGRRLFQRPDMGLNDKVDRLIERFRLAHLADERAGNLSYGQQKLLDTAMAFVSRPVRGVPRRARRRCQPGDAR
jgi:branched-chain amino acid transport system ATP-binding protein